MEEEEGALLREQHAAYEWVRRQTLGLVLRHRYRDTAKLFCQFSIIHACPIIFYQLMPLYTDLLILRPGI